MRTILSTLCAMLFIYPALAQQDSRAEPYLDAISDQFDMDEGYEIHIDYKREDLMRDTYAEGEGVIQMKGIKYKITVDEYIVYFNGTKQYSQNTETQEVYVSEPDPDQASFFYAVPISIIKAYKRDFKYQLMGKKLFMGKERMEIQLYPKKPGGPYALMKLYVNPATKKLEGVQIRHKEGILYTMVLTDIKGDQHYPDSLFTFDPKEYPDTDVIELVE